MIYESRWAAGGGWSRGKKTIIKNLIDSWLMERQLRNLGFRVVARKCLR